MSSFVLLWRIKRSWPILMYLWFSTDDLNIKDSTYFTNTPLHSKRKAKMVKGLHSEIDLYESDLSGETRQA